VSIPPVPLVPAVSYDDAPGPDPRDIVEALSEISDWMDETLIPAAIKGTSAVLEAGGKHAAGIGMSALVGVFEPDIGRWATMGAAVKLGAAVGGLLPIPGGPLIGAAVFGAGAGMAYDWLFE
jgi:hypothetical protein